MSKKKIIGIVGDNPAKEKKPLPTDTTVKESDFKTFEEWNAFLIFTRPILMKKVPKMPFRTLKDYLEHYNLMSEKKDNLTGIQRILVKNVIHAEMRKGTITLIQK